MLFGNIGLCLSAEHDLDRWVAISHRQDRTPRAATDALAANLGDSGAIAAVLATVTGYVGRIGTSSN
jgi:hypothetical protein